MNLAFKLISFREYKNWRREDVAKELGLSPESYTDLEKGRVKINGHIAQQLSELYQMPVEFFLIDDTPHYIQAEVVYTNCSFNGNGANGYINHNNTDRGLEEILFIRKEDIRELKREIAELKQQNNKLTEMLMQVAKNEEVR